jgi:fucose permease
MTPSVFGRDKSQAMIGIQMAFAYTGLCIMPPLFGFIAEHTSISLLPIYLLALLTLMAVMHETTVIKTKK